MALHPSGHVTEGPGRVENRGTYDADVYHQKNGS